MSKGLYSPSRLAAELGLDRRTVEKKLAELAPDVENERGGRVYRKYKLGRVVKHLAGTGAEDLAAERVKLLRAQRESAELDLAKKRGELADIADVESWIDLHVTNAKTRLLQMPSQLGPLVAMESDARRCRDMIYSAVIEALRELSERSGKLAEEL